MLKGYIKTKTGVNNLNGHNLFDKTFDGQFVLRNTFAWSCQLKDNKIDLERVTSIFETIEPILMKNYRSLEPGEGPENGNSKMLKYTQINSSESE